MSFSSPAASLLVGLLSSFKQALSWKALKETGRRVLKKLREPVCGQDSLCWAVSMSLILGGLKLIVFSEEMQRTNHLFADFAGKFGSPWYVIFLPFAGPVFVYILVPLGTLVFQGLEIYFNRPLPRDILHLLGVPAYLRREAADEIQNDRSHFIAQGLPASIGFMVGWGAWDGSIAMGLVWLFIVVTWTSIFSTDDNLGPKQPEPTQEKKLESEPGSAGSSQRGSSSPLGAAVTTVGMVAALTSATHCFVSPSIVNYLFALAGALLFIAAAAFIIKRAISIAVIVLGALFIKTQEELDVLPPGTRVAVILETQPQIYNPDLSSLTQQGKLEKPYSLIAELIIRDVLRKLKPGKSWVLSRREKNAVERWVGQDRLVELAKEYKVSPVENNGWIFHKGAVISSGLNHIIELLCFWR